MEKRKGGFKKFAERLGSKMRLKGKKENADDSPSLLSRGVGRLRNRLHKRSQQTAKDADSVVFSQDEDFTFADLSYKSSENSLNESASQCNNAKIKVESADEDNIVRCTKTDTRPQDDWDVKLYENNSKTSLKPYEIETVNRSSWDSLLLFFGIGEESNTDVKRVKSEELLQPPQKEWESSFPILKPFGKGQESKNRSREKLDVKIGFTVKSRSLSDLSKKEKHKSSIKQLFHVTQFVGTSLLSSGSMENRKDGSLRKRSNTSNVKQRQRTEENVGPVFVRDNGDFIFDDLSYKSSESWLSQPTPRNNNVKDKVKNPKEGSIGKHTVVKIPPKPPRKNIRNQDEYKLKLYGNNSKTLLKPFEMESANRRSWNFPTLSLRFGKKNDSDVKPAKCGELVQPPQKERKSSFSILKSFRKEKGESDLKKNKSSTERISIGADNENLRIETKVANSSGISNELIQKFEGKSREDLILMVCELQGDLDNSKKKLKYFEDYLDNLLHTVMETTSRLRQNPDI